MKTGKTKQNPVSRGVRTRNNQNSRSRDCRIAGKEVFAIVTCDTVTEFTSYNVNPSQDAVFPLLSMDAKRFQEAEVHSLSFHFLPTAATTRNGRIGLAFNPNADISVLPESFQQLENWGMCTMGPCYEPLTLRVNLLELVRKRIFNTMSTSNAATQIASLYNWGKIYFFSSGGDDGVCGEIQVEYDITLHNQNLLNDEVDLFRATRTGAPVAADNLLKGVTISSTSDNSMKVVNGEDVENPDRMLCPCCEHEGMIRMVATGTGFDATSALSAVATSGEAIGVAAADAVTNIVNAGATKLISEFFYSALNVGASFVNGAFAATSDAIDLLNFAFTGAGTISEYLIEVLPSISNVAFDSLPLLLAFEDSQFSSELRQHWLSLRRRGIKAASDPILGPIIKRSQRARRLGIKYNPDSYLMSALPNLFSPLSFQRKLLQMASPISATVVEPVAPVAKSRGGTCVMLPDFSSPKVSVPTPSLPQRKFVLICKKCRLQQDSCDCIDTDLVVRNCCTNNCKADCLAHPD